MNYSRPVTSHQSPVTSHQSPVTSHQSPATVPAERHILLTGRTLQALARLHFDVRPLLATDSRLRLTYSTHPGSQFESGARQLSNQLTHTVIPWSEVNALQPDLTISASAHHDLPDLPGKLLLLPHGAGHGRRRTGIDGVSGVSADQLRGHSGNLPDALALPGVAARDRLAIDFPEALPKAAVIGDVCLERLRGSAHCRSQYRRHLGIGERTLVVVASTWGPHSAYAANPSLPRRLLAQLPSDDYAVAFIPHPNVGTEHRGPLPELQRPACENGLIMPIAQEGWRALLIASDIVIGDHGSVTLYAAALDKPIALASFGSAEIPAGEPLRAFGATAPRFTTDTSWLGQLESLRDDPPSGRYREFTDQILYEPESARQTRSASDTPAALLTEMIYDLLDLDLPEYRWRPTLLESPSLERECRPTSSWMVRVRLKQQQVTWRRYPLAAWEESPDLDEAGDGFASAHQVSDVATRRPEWREAPVLLHHRQPVAVWEADAVLAEMVEHHPLCSVASVRVGENRSIVITRARPRQDSWRFEFTAEPGPLAAAALDICASALYWHLHRRDLAEFPSRLVAQRGQERLVVTVRQARAGAGVGRSRFGQGR
ncbi:hypothetical protein [Natronoglycomyces albus]|uniref:Uncharacterized protein n=1 Tax=Natronoglycomyces albus TaxID=2811108 RepID=A0A895XPL3_9ACTN|nr:hypothetical protein [Natronoglycomyces albus]QSB05682.1 hypothetical protein JQS30_01775 [Natronoglycomyces albus]